MVSIREKTESAGIAENSRIRRFYHFEANPAGLALSCRSYIRSLPRSDHLQCRLPSAWKAEDEFPVTVRFWQY
jgi:hypothetical protein